VELISVDSALVYRDMNIGTAKPEPEILTRAPHHLIDIIDPTDSYSAATFRREALVLMADITARGRVPLLVGGTMLYFRALRFGLSELPQADAAIRAEIEHQAAQIGWPALHAELAKVDADTAARLAPNDSQRINRALEIFRISGTPMSQLIAVQEKTELPYQLTPIALITSDRSVLHQRIATRFKQMLACGLLNEVKILQEKYALNRDLPSMRCVGYRQAWEYLAGEISEADLLEKGIAATRQLAKRQLTWLRGMPDSLEFDCLDLGLLEKIVELVDERV
jgi:tRNA dimethylallyltransferase